MLRAEMLGGFRVWWNDQPLKLPSRQARSLLAYLLVYPQPQSRDHLAGLFWPDLAEDQARKRLSQTLWQIRQALGEGSEWIWADFEQVGRSEHGHLETDHHALKIALGSSDLDCWKEALELYRGEFLRGYYEDWVLEERDHLLQTLLSKLEQLIRHYRAQGEPKAALEMARKLALLEPLHDEAHQEVMRLCLLLGKPREALEHFRKARVALEELGEPGPELEALKQQAELVRENPRQTSPLEGSGGLMLVGRSEEYQSLLEVLAQAQQRGRLVLLEGEAGMGKSRLLQELSREAAWRGFGLLQAKASERSGLRPFGLLQEALGSNLSALQLEQLRTQLGTPWLQAVAQVLPALVASRGAEMALRPEDEPTRLREGLAQLLQSLAGWAPQVLLLDDLHWADEGTLEVLPHLVQALAGHPVLMVLGYRSSEARERQAVWATLQKLSPLAARRIELKLLSQNETAELVRRSLGLAWPVPRFEARIYQETRGNPLFVLETLRSLYEEGLLHRDAEGVWSTPVDELTENYQELPLAPTVRQVIVERLGRLPTATRQVADALAVLGAADLEVLTKAVSRPRPEVLSMAASLIRQGLLVEREGKLAFAHDKIAQAAYEEIASEARRELHVRVGEVLETRDALPEELAGHFEQAGLWSKAASAYRQAGEGASKIHAYASALDLYSQALGLADRAGLKPAELYGLLKGKEYDLSILGKRQEQLKTLDVMQVMADDPIREIEVLIRRTNVLKDLSEIDQAEQCARTAIALAQSVADQSTLASALLNLGQVLEWKNLFSEAAQYVHQAVERYGMLGDTQGEARARHALGMALVHQDLPEAREEFERALELNRQNNNLQGQTSTLILLSHYHRRRENFELAQELLEQALGIAQRIGFRRGEALILLNLGNLLSLRSEVGQGIGLFEQAIKAFNSVGDRSTEALTSTNLAYMLLRAVGDVQRARELLVHTQNLCLELGEVDREISVLLTLARAESMDHDHSRAIAQMRQALARFPECRNSYYELQTNLTMGELLIEAGQNVEALIYLEKVEGQSSRLGQLGYVVPVALLRAKSLLNLGQETKAREALEAALSGDWERAQPSAHTYAWLYWVATKLDTTEQAGLALQKAHQLLQKSLQGLSVQQRQMSIERIPEHRLITQAWEAQNLQRQTFRIPTAEAPTGRPLRDDEYIEVAWTLHTPEDDKITDKTERRQVIIRRLLEEAHQQRAAPNVDDLAAALQSSKATVKRDLTALRARGVELKTRGSRV